MHVEPIGLQPRVLHVPKLLVSLVSVQRIAKLREYGILFDDTDGVLRNKVNRWRIGLARLRHGLYYLPNTIPSDGRPPNAQVTTIASSNMEETVILLNRRLGHPSFNLLLTMYPQFFENYPLIS